MSENTALLREADLLAAIADEVSASYATELRRVLRELEGQLRRLALEAQAGKQGALARAVRAAKARRQIQKALEAAGYKDLAGRATGDALDRLVLQLERLRLAAELEAFTAVDWTRILALKELAKTDLLGQGDEIAHAVWRTLARGLFAQTKPADLLDDLADALDVELYEARTMYDTAINVFARQVEAMKSTPEDVFLYLGPADKKLRPFCRAHVGKVYTRSGIDDLDNGQLPNVFLTGGGYNCRHSWVALSKASPLRALVGTDERMPEVEAQIQRVEAGDRKAA